MLNCMSFVTSLDSTLTPSPCSTIDAMDASSRFVRRMFGATFSPFAVKIGSISSSKPREGMRKSVPSKSSTGYASPSKSQSAGRMATSSSSILRKEKRECGDQWDEKGVLMEGGGGEEDV